MQTEQHDWKEATMEGKIVQLKQFPHTLICPPVYAFLYIYHNSGP